MAAKKARKPASRKTGGDMSDIDRISNAKRLQILNQLNKEISSLGPRATAPRQQGKPPSPSSQYRGLANVRDALSGNSLRGNKFVSRSGDAKGTKGTGRSFFRRGGGLFTHNKPLEN